MTSWILAIVSAQYAGVAVSYLPQRPGMCLAFVGYVIANMGLIWDALTYGKV